MNKLDEIKKIKIVQSLLVSMCATLLLLCDKQVSVNSWQSFLGAFSNADDQWLPLFVFIGGTALVFEFLRSSKVNNKFSWCVSIILSVLFVVGSDVTYSQQILRGSFSKWSLLFFVIRVVMAVVVSSTLIPILYQCVKHIQLSERMVNPLRWEWKLFNTIFIPMLLIRLVILLMLNPANMSFDSMTMLSQAIGIYKLTNSHPFLYVKFLSFFVRFGEAYFNSVGKGLLLFSLFSILFTSLVWSWILVKVLSFVSQKWLRLGLILLFCLHPYFVVYSFTIYKDIFLVNFLLLFVGCLLDIIYSGKQFYHEPQHLLIWIVSILGIYEMHRKAIIYLVVGIVSLFVFEKQSRKQLFLYTGLALAVTLGVHKVAVNRYTPLPSEFQYDYLSTRFQQVATVMKNYPEDFTQIERETYDTIFKIENLKDYSAQIVDPIKKDVKNEVFKEHQSDFWKLWRKGYWKHPKSYVDAVANLSVSYWYPYKKPDPLYIQNYYNFIYGKQDPSWSKLWKSYADEYRNGKVYDEGWTYQTEKDVRTKQEMNTEEIIEDIIHLPIIGMIAIPGYYTWGLFGMIAVMIYQRKKYLWPLAFLIISVILTCVYSPVVSYFRYSYVFMVLVPLMIPLVIHQKKNEIYP